MILILVTVTTTSGSITYYAFQTSERKPMLSLDLACNATREGVKYPQSLNIVTVVTNDGMRDIRALTFLQKAPVGFDVHGVRAKLQNGTIVACNPVETSDGLKYTLATPVEPSRSLTIFTMLKSTLESKTSNFTIMVNGIYGYPGLFGFGAQERTIAQSTSVAIVVPLENWYSILRDIRDQEWLSYALQTNLCIQDGKVTDEERNYLTNPTMENADKVLKSYLLEIARISQQAHELSEELRKLPEFKPKNTTVEALEDIITVACKPSNAQGFALMLDEGIKEKRRYCAPLQALIWYAYDFEFDQRGEELTKSPSALVEFSWARTSTSDNYRSNRWMDFDEVVDRLSSPRLIAIYMKVNIRYKEDPPNRPWQEIFQDALTTFNRKAGDCEDHAMFGAYCLERNGYEAWVIGAFPYRDKGDGGHAVTLFKEPKTPLFYLFDNTMFAGVRGMSGPYSSIDEAVNYVSIKPTPWVRYIVWDTSWRIIVEKSR